MVEDNYSVKVFVTKTEEFGGISLTHSNGTDSINCSLLNIENNMLVNAENPLVSFRNTDLQQGTATKYFSIFKLETMVCPVITVVLCSILLNAHRTKKKGSAKLWATPLLLFIKISIN